MTLYHIETLEKLLVAKEKLSNRFFISLSFFKENYKMIATDSSNQQALDDDSRAIQQNNFTGNLDRADNKTMVNSWRSRRHYYFLATRNCESIVNVSLNNLIHLINITIKLLSIIVWI